MFYVNLPINTQVTSHLITVRLLSLIKRYDVCTKQDQEREQGIQLPVSLPLRDHYYICHGARLLGCHNVKNGSFSSSSMNCMSIDNIIGVFYHLNKMLIATKHIADNNVFQ